MRRGDSATALGWRGPRILEVHLSHPRLAVVDLPRIIQGGMGVGISGWRLARAVARHGQLGVVSGTGASVTLARRLQDGDLDGHLRRALAALPAPDLRALGRLLPPGSDAYSAEDVLRSLLA